MSVAEAQKYLPQEPYIRELLAEPYVKRVIDLAGDESLFRKTPEQLEELRTDLLRQGLKFHMDHNPNLERDVKHICKRLDKTVEDIELKDLVHLAFSSNKWRGEGQIPYLIEEVVVDGEPAEDLKTYRSSGTTTDNRVTVHRNPIDLYINRLATTLHFEHNLGHKFEPDEGVLFMAVPELREDTIFVDAVARAMENRGLEVVFGMQYNPELPGRTIWEKMVPLSEVSRKFFKDKYKSRYMFTGNVGLHRMLKSYDELPEKIGKFKASFARKAMSDFGKQGAIIIGGGPKGGDIPKIEELIEMTMERMPKAPLLDVLGWTEGQTIMPSIPNSTLKTIHPTTHVLVYDPETLEPADEGALIVYEPLSTTFFGAFEPGDKVQLVDSDDYYGKNLRVVGRMLPEEGGVNRGGCGETG